MKIIHLISGYLGQGGAERLVVDLAEAQAQLGHDVTICTFRDLNERSLPVPAGVKHHSFGKKKGLSPELGFTIKAYFKIEKPDIVNCHLPAVFPYLVPSLIRCKDVKFFYTIHNKPSYEEQRKAIRMLRSYFIRKGRIKFIAISDQIKKEFEDLYSVRNIPRIYNGRKSISKTKEFDTVKKETEALKKNANTIVFVAVGRLFEQKNYPLMLKAFDKLSNLNVLLIVLGQGNTHQYDSIKPNNVHFLGSKNNVCDFLLCADAFCMSSTFEGFPISIIEAMSIGLPILSTKVGGITDIIKEGENGFLSNSLEVEEYVKMLQKFLSLQPGELEVIKDNNRKAFETLYDIKISAQNYIGTYRQ